MSFLKLTLIERQSPLYINPTTISGMWESPVGTTIYGAGAPGGAWQVKETPEQIIEAINDPKRNSTEIMEIK